MLHMLLLALWFQDKHATQVKFTAGNHSHNMQAECTCFLNALTLFHVLAKNVFVIIEKI